MLEIKYWEVCFPGENCLTEIFTLDLREKSFYDSIFIPLIAVQIQNIGS